MKDVRLIWIIALMLGGCNSSSTPVTYGDGTTQSDPTTLNIEIQETVVPKTYSSNIELINSSAEENTAVTDATLGMGDEFGWQGTGPCFYVNTFVAPGNGKWRINLAQSCSINQLTGHVISANESYALTFDASPFAGLPRNIIAELFAVDSEGLEVSVARRNFNFNQLSFNDWRSYQLLVDYGDLQDHSGKRLGIRFINPSQEAQYLSVDNIQLEVHKQEDKNLATFIDSWTGTCDQLWVGKNFWANRIHDWQVRAGRLETLIPKASQLRRTVHRISSVINSRPDDFSLMVNTGVVSGSATANSYSGFLIGAGFRLDYRAASLIHNRHGKNGGLIAGMDHNGRAFIRDNDIGNQLLAIAENAPEANTTQLKLRLNVQYLGDSQYRLTMIVADLDGNQLNQVSTVVGAERVMGNIALISNPGIDPLTKHWFNSFQGQGEKLINAPEREFGPIMFTSYTLSRQILTMNAQLPPVCNTDYTNIRLQRVDNDQWIDTATADMDSKAYTAQLRVFDWNDSEKIPVRVAVDVKHGQNVETAYYYAYIQADPKDRNEITIAGFTGRPGVILGPMGWIQQNSNQPFSWTESRLVVPHRELLGNAEKHNADLNFFSGDQIYEFDPNGFIDKTSDQNQVYDYLYKWYLYGWSVGNYIRNIPTIIIPDDHDVFQGNLWGENGRHSDTEEGGGYVYPANFIDIVQKTQTGSLPPPFDSTPVEQQISVYYTDIIYGGIGIALLEDRKFKSGPHSPDRPRKLLGDRQQVFLDQWVEDWQDQEMKLVLSQAPFAMSHTHSGSGFKLSGLDLDSNGWPSDLRQNAVASFRKAFAPHFNGDQHLGLTLKHGIDNPADAVYSFSVPSMLNIFPRVWDPANRDDGPGDPAAVYTGSFSDQHGNLIDVIAAANPNNYYKPVDDSKPASKYDLGIGYGVMKINKAERSYEVAAWPVDADPTDITARPYEGWPIKFNQNENDGRIPIGYLPSVEADIPNPVVKVFEEPSNNLVYAKRLQESNFSAPVYKSEVTYKVELSDPNTGYLKIYTDLEIVNEN